MGAAFDRFIEAANAHGYTPRFEGPSRARIACPAHGGDDRNVVVAEGDQGVLVRCFSHDCQWSDIAAALDLTPGDLFDNQRSAEYQYDGGHRVIRERITPAKPGGKDKRIKQVGHPGERTTLYRHPNSAAIESHDGVVVVVEGEKTVDAVLRMGAHCVTTWPGGVPGVDKVDTSPLRGKKVRLIPDSDVPGKQAMQSLTDRLVKIGCEVEVWQVPEPHNDAADLYLAGGSLADLRMEPLDLKLPWMRRSELRSRPKPEWFIDGIVQGAGLIVIAGQPGIGKSFLALDMACRIATGTEFFGHKVRRGRVGYVAAEGLEFMDLRQEAWERVNDVVVPEDQLIYLGGESFSMLDPLAVEDMIHDVALGKVDLVVMDTFSQLAGLDDENAAAAVANALNAARRIRMARPGASVIVIHHLTKSEKPKLRGSGAIRGNADAVLVMFEGEMGDIVISSKAESDGKQKNAPMKALPGFKLDSFDLEVDGAREMPVLGRQGDEDDPAAKMILRVLDDGRPHSAEDFEAVWSDQSYGGKQRVRRRLNSLANSGIIWRHGDVYQRDS